MITKWYLMMFIFPFMISILIGFGYIV